jgi:hypothetical protein
MKTYLKLAMLAMMLIAPAGVCAADLVGGPIGNYQEAQQEPQRILDPLEFFDKTTGKIKVWYWRAESGYEFYDAPGFHPRTGQALAGVTLDVITEWQQSKKNATRCYIIQRDPSARNIPRSPAWDGLRNRTRVSAGDDQSDRAFKAVRRRKAAGQDQGT